MALTQKAYYVSADPDVETRQQEELEYNLENDNIVRPLITRSDKTYNKKSNKSTVKSGKNKITLPNFEFTIEYTDHWTGKKKIRKKLPTVEYSSENLSILTKCKRIAWNPACLQQRGFKFSYLAMQDNPFIVLDIDDVLPDEVERKVKESWKLNLPFSVVASSSGTGTHLHIWVNLAKEPAPRPGKMSQFEVRQHYRTTFRFEVWMGLKAHFAKTIAKDTGLEVDMGAARREHIAITPNEIGAINEYWKDREPVVIPETLINEAMCMHRSKHELKNQRYLVKFIEEWERFIADPAALESVLTYLRDTGVKVGPIKYYEKVLKCLTEHKDEVVEHWIKNRADLAWLRMKTKDVHIEQATVAAKLFGLASPKHATYLRHFALYIFSMIKTQDRIINRIPDAFTFIDVPKPHFTSDFLARNWYAASVDDSTLTVEFIAKQMGGGKTWQTIHSVTPVVRWRYGSDAGTRIMLEALAQSSANNKRQRRREIQRFMYVLDRDHGKVEDRITG